MDLASDNCPDNELGTPHGACPICDSRVPRIRQCRLQVDPVVWMSLCTECAASIADRFPSNNYLGEIYDPKHYKGTVTSSPGVSAKLAAYITSKVRFPAHSNLRILDFGGGDGGVLKAVMQSLRGSGHRGALEGVVVDLYPGQLDEGVGYLAASDFMGGSACGKFDLVIASAVIEHLPDAGAVLEKLVEVCADNGLLYARTPFEIPLSRWIPGYRIRWPRHLLDLGPAFWTRFCDKRAANLALVDSRASIVETEFRKAPLRTLFAYLLKAPSRFETGVLMPFFGYRRPRWSFVGGWEILIKVRK